MQTQLADDIRETAEGREADAILRKCVHCGFCTATCPTYQLLGDELDGPRGRIYLIKQMLEGGHAGARTQLHLDRCLTCRACETACPSGVEYGRLLDIGRGIAARRIKRGFWQSLQRRALLVFVPHRGRFAALLRIARWTDALLPAGLKRKVRTPVRVMPSPLREHPRKMLVLEGCVQPTLSPNTNAAAARVLDMLGITLVAAPRAGCCGAVSYHTDAQSEGLDYARLNIDAWLPQLDAGAEAIVVTASGCATMVTEYGRLLAHDPGYAAAALRVSAAVRDISEIINVEKDRLEPLLAESRTDARIAFHAPCSLQHGLRMQGKVESLLTDLGLVLTSVPDAHLCCGSAGTYSILQPRLSRQLLDNKVAALMSGAPSVIVTANVGCQSHLQSATELPVMHWIELLDRLLRCENGHDAQR